jgi:hypothetical protein
MTTDEPIRDERPARYVEPYDNPEHPHITEKVVYRASGLGGCERSLVATARDIPRRDHPEWFQAVLDEGTEAEAEIRRQFHVAMLEDPVTRDGWEDQAELEMTIANIEGRLVVVRAHADDVHRDGRDGGGAVLREYKKFRTSTFGEFLRRGVEVQPYYPWQVAAMMWALRDAGYNVVCQFVGGEFDGESIVRVEHETLADPPIPRAGILQRVARLERMVNEGLDPSEIDCPKLYPCGHWFLHDEDEIVALDDPDAAQAVADWEDADDQVKAAKAALKAAEDDKKKITETLRGFWPDDGKAQVTFSDGTRHTLTRVVRVVEPATIERKGYTSDYFQKSKGST